MADEAPPLHDWLQPIAFLVGEWHGNGEGLWPGGFTFTDAMRFAHDGRPLLRYDQVTAGPAGVPSHAECGFFTVQENGDVHVTLAEASGITEILVGRPGSEGLDLDAVDIGRTPTTDNVTSCRRRLRLVDGALLAEIDMAVNGEALAPHTRSVLHRTS